MRQLADELGVHITNVDPAERIRLISSPAPAGRAGRQRDLERFPHRLP